MTICELIKRLKLSYTVVDNQKYYIHRESSYTVYTLTKIPLSEKHDEEKKIYTAELQHLFGIFEGKNSGNFPAIEYIIMYSLLHISTVKRYVLYYI